MKEVLQVTEAKGSQEVRFLTLTDCSGNSENRYYVCLTGLDARVDWQEGDRIMMELSACAYYHRGQWYSCHRSDAVKLIEIGNSKDSKKL